MATSLHDIPGEHVASVPLREHAAATATESQYAWVAPFKCKITEIGFRPDGDITGADTNYTTVSLKIYDDADGSVGSALDTAEFTSGTNKSAGSMWWFDPGVIELNQFDTVVIEWAKVASGLKIPTCQLVIKYQGA